MKKFMCFIFLISVMILFSACSSSRNKTVETTKEEVTYLRNLDTADEEQIAKDTFEQALKAIQEKDEKKVKELFSTKALKEAKNLEINMRYLFNLYQGDLVSWELDGVPSVNERIESGIKTKRFVYYCDIITTENQYVIFILQYPSDIADTENEGIYALRMIKAEDENTQFGYMEDMEIAGIYNPANMETPTMRPDSIYGEDE